MSDNKDPKQKAVGKPELIGEGWVSRTSEGEKSPNGGKPAVKHTLPDADVWNANLQEGWSNGK